MPDPVSAGIGLATGLAQTVTGIINSAKTKKIAKELELSRPKYQISNLATQDLDLAESEASGGGLSATAQNAYNNLDNQQFASSLDAILKSGGTVNNVADVYGNNQEGRTRLAILSDQMRMSKIQNLMKAREMYRGEQDKEFQINDFAPWRDKQAANAEARQKAQNQIWGGIGTAASAGMNFFGGKFNEDQYDKFLNRGQGGGTGSAGGFAGAAGTRSGFNPAFNFGNRTQTNSQMFNPNNPTDDYGIPDYLTNPDWQQGAHYMF